jgi:hypothetical protein
MTTTGKLGIELLRGSQDTEAISSGQLEIGKDNSRTRLAKLMNRLGFVARFEDDMALRLERMTQHGAQRVLVFDQKNWKGCYRSHQTRFMAIDCLIFYRISRHEVIRTAPPSRRATTSILRCAEYAAYAAARSSTTSCPGALTSLSSINGSPSVSSGSSPTHTTTYACGASAVWGVRSRSQPDAYVCHRALFAPHGRSTVTAAICASLQAV